MAYRIKGQCNNTKTSAQRFFLQGIMRKLVKMPLNKVCSWSNSFEYIYLTSSPKEIPKYVGFAAENMHERGNNECKFDAKGWEIQKNLRTITWNNN